MHYGQIFDADVANGPGFRVSVFVSGCRNHCPGCFQPETWDFNYGKEWNDDVMRRVVEMLCPGHIRGLTVLGGDPFEPENIFQVTQLMTHVRNAYQNKDIWVYTGYTYEYLRNIQRYHPSVDQSLVDSMLSCIDVLVDGPFVEAQKDLTLTFRGSRNQRLINLRAMRETGNLNEIRLWEE